MLWTPCPPAYKSLWKRNEKCIKTRPLKCCWFETISSGQTKKRNDNKKEPLKGKRKKQLQLRIVGFLFSFSCNDQLSRNSQPKMVNFINSASKYRCLCLSVCFFTCWKRSEVGRRSEVKSLAPIGHFIVDVVKMIHRLEGEIIMCLLLKIYPVFEAKQKMMSRKVNDTWQEARVCTLTRWLLQDDVMTSIHNKQQQYKDDKVLYTPHHTWRVTK